MIDDVANQDKIGLTIEGDGSGTRAGHPMGWAAKISGHGPDHWVTGGCSTGTNNVAELLPCLMSLWDHHSRGGSPCRVRIVTDSEVVARGGRREWSRSANGPFWAAVEWFETMGYVLEWAHSPRNGTAALKEADRRAGRAARLIGMMSS